MPSPRLRALVDRATRPFARAIDRETLCHSRDAYTGLAVLDSRYDYRSETLAAAEVRVFSQNGEDGVIAELLSRIGVAERHFVEFGASFGQIANCIFLADVRGWSGLFLEGDDEAFAALESKYRHNPAVRTVQTFVTPDNLNTLLEQGGVPDEVDVVSIDVDGQDYYLWEALTCVRPRIVVIEYNSSLDPQEALVEPRGLRGEGGRSDYFGSSVAALVALGRRKGYTLVHLEMTGVNAFFVRDDLVDRVGEIRLTYRRPNFRLLSEGLPPDPLGRTYLALSADGAGAPPATSNGNSPAD